ncbi:MAG: hypothetical protein GY937_20250 [bacterium]|nr:hypothetical protein [bacterium]
MAGEAIRLARLNVLDDSPFYGRFSGDHVWPLLGVHRGFTRPSSGTSTEWSFLQVLVRSICMRESWRLNCGGRGYPSYEVQMGLLARKPNIEVVAAKSSGAPLSFLERPICRIIGRKPICWMPDRKGGGSLRGWDFSLGKMTRMAASFDDLLDVEEDDAGAIRHHGYGRDVNRDEFLTCLRKLAAGSG